MSRVLALAASGAIALSSTSLLIMSASPAEAKRVKVRPAVAILPGVGAGAASASKAQADIEARSDAGMPAKTYLTVADKPTVADAETPRSRGELARMRADRALSENGEKSKVEDEEVMGKDDVDPDDVPATANAGKGERVVVKPTEKIVCIAGCN